jgi:2-haloacid dehalogenase
VDLLRFGGWRVDAVLSAELAASYKPDPVVYRRGVALLGCLPEEVAMVAAHAGDLVAAAAVGLRPMFVRRPDEWGTGVPEEPPAGLPGLLVADDLEHLAGLLGC